MHNNGEAIINQNIVEKVIYSLNLKFVYIFITIKESTNIYTMIVDEFMGFLQVHEKRFKEKSRKTIEEACKVNWCCEMIKSVNPTTLIGIEKIVRLKVVKIISLERQGVCSIFNVSTTRILTISSRSVRFGRGAEKTGGTEFLTKPIWDRPE